MKKSSFDRPAIPVIPANNGAATPMPSVSPSVIAEYGMRAADRQLQKQRSEQSLEQEDEGSEEDPYRWATNLG